MQQLSDQSVGSIVLALTSVKPSLPVLLSTPYTGTHEISHIEIQDTTVILHGHSDENAPLHTDRTLMQTRLTTVSVLLGMLQTVPRLWHVAISTPTPTPNTPVPMTHMRQSTLAQTVLLSHTG
jgi:hypothetical protein